jgi:pantoate--beta-alanine ligase
MLVFEKIKDTTSFLLGNKEHGQTIGFVPTMGALHQGHLELMRRAKKENDLLVVSIFVNPIQFNNAADLEKYPRDLEKDKTLLEEIGCDVLFVPEVNEMYPEKATKQFNFGELEKVMEGAFRPGHFNGVAVVVEKLFDIVKPNRAYFGEKDFQQLAIIQRMVELEKIPVQIVPCPTIREKDGLAMSSRNERLTEAERKLAPFIAQTLNEAKSKISFMAPNEIRLLVENKFSDQPEFELEYFEIADDKTLQPTFDWTESQGIVGFIAAYLGKVRLIDNIRFI